VIKIVSENEKLGDYNPLNDFLFLKYMAEKGCEQSLMSFINALFNEYGKKVDDIKLISDKVIPVKLKGEKGCFVDLRAESSQGQRFIVEMQATDSNEFRKRAFHYICREFGNSVAGGKDNLSYDQHILINITNFGFEKNKRYRKEENFYQKFNYVEKTKCKLLYTDLIEIYNIDLVKFRNIKIKDINNPLHQWAIFFCKKRHEKEFKEVLKMNDSIKLADEKAKEVLSDGESRRIYEQIELRTHQIEMEFKEAEKRAMEKGRKEGREEGMKKTAISLLNEGFDVSKISELTGLSLNDVKNLKK